MLRLKHSTWILLAGLIGAGVVLGAGSQIARHLEEEQFRARFVCDFVPDDPAAAAKERAECNRLSSAAPDDAKVARAQLLPKLVAAIIVTLCALPWAWYFLLRRIAELRAAIGGNPPAR